MNGCSLPPIGPHDTCRIRASPLLQRPRVGPLTDHSHWQEALRRARLGQRGKKVSREESLVVGSRKDMVAIVSGRLREMFVFGSEAHLAGKWIEVDVLAK